MTLRRHDGPAAADMLDVLGDVYADARAEPPYSGDRRWSRDAFVARTAEQVTRPGFVLVTAHVDDGMVGFAFGQPLEAGRWFTGDTDPPPALLAAPKFGVTELDVGRAWRRRGIGRALLDDLLSGRSEPYAILSTLPDTPARQMYKRWGWRKVANTVPGSGLPPWDTLALPLADR